MTLGLLNINIIILIISWGANKNGQLGHEDFADLD
jgi:hypothetical protein